MDADTLHHDAVVADTHNDLILLVDHHDRRGQHSHFGDFWLPELRRGGVDVQVLPIFLEEPFQLEGGLRRTLLLVERIHELAAEFSNNVAVCLDGADMDKAVGEGKIALVIALEGAHAIGQDVALLRSLYRVGVRVVSIAHFGRTRLADGSGLDQTSAGGLTPEGIAVFQEMERLGIVFDVSHLGARGVDDVLGLARRPMLATHSACLALTDIHRNLGDEQLRQISRLGGVVCVAAAIPQFIGPERPTAQRVVDHIEHLIDVAGVDHVGIGPDFIDDYYQQVFGGWTVADAIGSNASPAEVARPSDLPKLTAAMLDRGFAESDVRQILGGNVVRVLREVMGVPTSGQTLQSR